MTLSWALIGAIVGLLLGITGAGGAIVAVPLFVYLAHVSLRDATVLSLIAVMSGASLNWLVQRKNTHYLISTLLFLFSTAGSALFRGVKALSPDWVIAFLFAAVGLASLISVWKKDEKGRESRRASILSEKGLPEKGNSQKGLLLKSTLGGFGLGGLVTMTGLGGGVVIMPFLKGAFKLPLATAAATSLLTILLSSVFTLWLQQDLVARYLDLAPILALVAGSTLSALGTKQLLKRVDEQRLNLLRRFLITVVIVVSAGSLILGS